MCGPSTPLVAHKFSAETHSTLSVDIRSINIMSPSRYLLCLLLLSASDPVLSKKDKTSSVDKGSQIASESPVAPPEPIIHSVESPVSPAPVVLPDILPANILTQTMGGKKMGKDSFRSKEGGQDPLQTVSASGGYVTSSPVSPSGGYATSSPPVASSNTLNETSYDDDYTGSGGQA